MIDLFEPKIFFDPNTFLESKFSLLKIFMKQICLGLIFYAQLKFRNTNSVILRGFDKIGVNLISNLYLFCVSSETFITHIKNIQYFSDICSKVELEICRQAGVEQQGGVKHSFFDEKFCYFWHFGSCVYGIREEKIFHYLNFIDLPQIH